MASRNSGMRSRRGSFGLQPRVVPNISNQIISLAQQYVAKRDQNIMDAWKNGGTFEGNKVTDDMVLSYWKGREAGLDPGDPTYEAASNQIMQLQYGIEQSKADVLHTQGKMSDGAYAQFFLKWAQKVPANSEFYRTLQKDAAQLVESAKNKGIAATQKAKTDAFNAFVSGTTKSDISIADALTSAVTELGKQTGLSVTADGDQLMAMLTQNVKAHPEQYKALLDSIHAGDPHWDGQITAGYFNQHIKMATQGYELIADRAHKDGYVSAYANATQGASSMSQWGQNLKVWPVAQSYTTAENAFLKVWNSPTASQMDKQAAASAFGAACGVLAKTPGIDPGSSSMLAADANRLAGNATAAGDSPSFGASMLGRGGITPAMASTLTTWTQTSTSMALNPTAWAIGPVDSSGNYDSTAKGPLGIVPAGQVPPGAQGVMVPGLDGRAVLAMISPHSVYASDPNNPSASPKLVGFEINYNVGATKVQMWGYQDAAGKNHWSNTSPVVQGATTQTDNKGDIYVTPPASAVTDPIARAKELDAKLGTNIAAQLTAQQSAGVPLGGVTVVQNQLDPKGHVIGSVELTYNNGTFTATQKQNTIDASGHVTATQSTPLNIAVATPQASAFSPSTLAAGDIPGATFSSPLQASVHASGFYQSLDQVMRNMSDPAFKQAFLSQVMQTIGTSDMNDPRVTQAWTDITTASPTPAASHGASTVAPAYRTDLTYPGQKGDTSHGTAPLNITIGGGLVIPGAPSNSLVASAAAQSGAAPNGSIFDNIHGLGGVLPGLGVPSQQAAGSPAVTAQPAGPTPTASPVTPVVLPTTPLAGTPAPAPAPTPPTTISTGPYRGKQVPT